MKKLFLHTLTLLSFSILLFQISCKKEKEVVIDNTNPKIVGIWGLNKTIEKSYANNVLTKEYTSTNYDTSLYYIEFKSDGSGIDYQKYHDPATFTWKLVDNKVILNYIKFVEEDTLITRLDDTDIVLYANYNLSTLNGKAITKSLERFYKRK